MKTMIVLAMMFAVPLVADGSRTAESATNCDAACQEQLSAAREGTAMYHREVEALADGFVSTHHCLAGPGDAGAMGIHYPNLGRMRDTRVDPALPEILLYEPQADGRVRLVGLEYFVPVLSNGRPWTGGPDNPPPVIDNAAPVLFGRRFQGPMPGHEPGQPWHYDLHVWAWRYNPAGTFALFNPKVSCAPDANRTASGSGDGHRVQ